MRVDTLTPVLDAAPGESIVGRVRVVNDGLDDAAFTVRVVGLDGHDVVLEVPGGPIGPGLSADVDVPLDVPAVLGVGQHAVALEVSSDRPDDRPALAQLTVSIDSLERVQMAPRPSTVRAGRNGRFTLDVINNETTTVDVLLGGEATDVAVTFDPPTVRLHPGERGWVRGRIRARQRWGGESIHHVLTLTARGRSSTTSTTMAYIQRPVVPGKARNAVAAFVVIAMFLGAIGGGLWWWSQRDTTEMATRDADGQLDQLDGTGTGTGTSTGTGADGDAGTDGSGGGGADGDAGADAPLGPGAIPTFTVVTGTVSTSGGDPSGVTVAIAPIELGRAADTDATIVGLAGRSRGPAKIWSARHAVRPSAVSVVRQTESVPAVTTAAISTDGEGLWRFVDIPIRQNYELVFSKPGYDTRSFVITPPDDGSRVELDVELVPGTGQLSGTVVGPDGPLGGVDIVVTDGTLTFRTTSATEASGAGQVGSFAIEGLSTPAVYTLKASLRGYGTEVLQLPYGAGQERSGTLVSMRPGVGSISGRVTSAGEPRGGVTVVASNGDATFTTTTLTEGDVGAYSIPRLEIPGEYTVTAALPGFITQTRRVELTGNATGVDYQLVPTTAGISGRVMSSNGNPIVGAGITVSLDDVGFRSATAASPVPGSFNIDDLPPGTYLVRIARFDHLPFSQQVTVGAGETVDLGTITLEFTERPPIAALGSIAVRVFDSDDADLTGATVSLYELNARAGVDDPIASIADAAGEQSTFVFDNVATGTYRVRVTRPIYRTVERRVSVGLGRQDVQVRMLRLGQASGQIVTADGRPLRSYALNIYRREASGAETLVEPNVSVVASREEDDDGKILWESKPDSLVAGTYRIEVINQPPGYEVIPNQVLDPTVTQTPSAMLFRVPADSEEPVEVGDIVADPLPLIGGRLFVPQYTAGSGTTMRALTLAEVDALPGLGITLVCGDAPLDADVPLVRPSPVEPYEGFELPELANHFEFTPFALQEANAVGDCRLDVVATGFIDTSVALTTPIRPSSGAADPRQRTVNVALMEKSNPLFGRVFWVDGTEEIDLVGVNITSDPTTVIGSRPRQGAVFGDTTAPEIRRGSLTTASTEGGSWEFVGDTQLFGAATYTFRAQNFADGLLEVVLDDGSNPATTPTRTIREVGAGTGDDAIALRATVRPLDQGVDVELLAPQPGPLSGSVEILTSRPAPAFDAVGRRAERGAEGPLALDYDGAGPPIPNPRPFLRESVPAGTWDVVFTLPANHDFFDHASGPDPDAADLVVGDGDGDDERRYRKRVEPGTGASGFDTTLVELGTVQVTVDFDDLEAGDQPTSETTYRLESPAGETLDPRDPVTDTAANYVRVPVHPTDPLGSAVGYDLEVLREGYDEGDATITIRDRTDPTNSPFPSTVFDPAPASSQEIRLEMVAGRDLEVEVTLPQYGTLTGIVEGFANSILQYPPDGRLVVTAERIRDPAGELLVPDPDDPEPPPDIGPTESEDTSFVMSGRPGTYRISVRHPFYAEPGADVDPKLELMVNTEARAVSDRWELEVLKSSLTVEVLGSVPDADSTERVRLDDARVTLTRLADDVQVAQLPSVDGEVTVPELVPGDYRLDVRRFAVFDSGECPDPADIFDVCVPTGPSWSGDEIAFPVIATLTVTPGETEADRTLQVTVKLPGLKGQITGEVQGRNSDGEAVVAPHPVTITRTYQPSAIEVAGGDPLSNEAPEDFEDFEVPEGSTPNATSRAFTIMDVAGGTHSLVFSDAPGYELASAPESVNVDDVDGGGTNQESVVAVYQADDVDLTVTLRFPSAVSDPKPELLLDHSAVTGQVGTVSEPVVTSIPGGQEWTFVIAGVPPRDVDYALTVVEPFSRPVGGNPIMVPVRPSADDPEPLVISMEATKGTVTGVVQQQSSEIGASNLQGDARIVLSRGSNFATSVFVDDEELEGETDVRGSFSFDITRGDTYWVVIEKDDYLSVPVSVRASPGKVNPLPSTVFALKKHEVTIGVSTPAGHVGTTTVRAIAATAGSPAISGTETDGTWTFWLDPDTAYRFEVQRSGFYRIFIPRQAYATPPASTDPPDRIDAIIGGSSTYSDVTLIDRVIKVEVTGPTSPATGDPVPVTATLTMNDVEYSLTSDAAASGTTTIEFRSSDVTAPISLTHPASVEVAADAFRTRTFSSTDVLDEDGDVVSTTWPIDGYASDIVALNASASTRSISFPVTMQPDITEISGSITGTSEVMKVRLYRNNVQVGAEQDSVVTTAGEVTTNTYTFTLATGYEPGDYEVVVEKLGVGRGANSGEITETLPTGDTLPLSVTVAERNVTVTATVSGSEPPLSQISIFRGTATTALSTTADTDARTLTFTVGERSVESSYQARASGRIWVDRSLALTNVSGTGANLTAPMSITLDPFTVFSGTVTDGEDPPVGIEGASLRLYEGACPTGTPTAGLVGGPVFTDEDGIYAGLTKSAGGLAGNFCITATVGETTTSRAVVVPATAETPATQNFTFG